MVKTILLVINQTFNDSYWRHDGMTADETLTGCTSDSEIKKDCQTSDAQKAIELVISGALVASILFEILCWKYRTLAHAIQYVECVWALFDAFLLMDSDGRVSFVNNSARMAAIVVFYGTHALASTITVTVCAALAPIATYIVAG